jgi:hypothetical protein
MPTPIPGTILIDAIVPDDIAATYPTHYSKYGKGGNHSYATILERNDIPAERREYGMTVYVEATGREYTLKTGLTNSDWEETISTVYVDQAIDDNAIIKKYKRGFNDTGATISAYKFVSLGNGFTATIPKIKAVDSYNNPSLGLLIADLADQDTVDFPEFGVFQLPNGILNTTAIAIGTPIYCTSAGDFTLTWTPIKVGYTLSQATNPHIFLAVSETIEKNTSTVFSPTNTAPANPIDGQIYYDSDLKCIMFYDASRLKWLSNDTYTFTVGSNATIAAGVSLQSSGVATSTTPLSVGADNVCLVAIMVTTGATENFTLGVDDVKVGTNLLNVVVPSGTLYNNKNLNQNYDAGNALDVYIKTLGSSGNINRPVVTMIFRRRK